MYRLLADTSAALPVKGGGRGGSFSSFLFFGLTGEVIVFEWDLREGMLPGPKPGWTFPEPHSSVAATVTLCNLSVPGLASAAAAAAAVSMQTERKLSDMSLEGLRRRPPACSALT